MDGFFVTIDCSEIVDSNETSYKIYIDKNKMSIVYELIERIRFMFNLEKCFFLIHEDSVIHELEDIKVLELLKDLEIRPCLRSNCIHKKLDKNLFSKLNLFKDRDEMMIHKLFQAKYNFKSNVSSLQSPQNFFEEINKSKLVNNQYAITSPSKLTHSFENDKTQFEFRKEQITNENQLDLNEINTSAHDKKANFDEINSPKNVFTLNLQSSAHSNSNNNLNLFTASFAESPVNKKQKLQSEPKTNFAGRKNPRRTGIPFSVGALLSEMREKAQVEELKKKQEAEEIEESNNSVYVDDKTAEDNLLINDKSLLKRKRKRRHKKHHLKVDVNCAQTNLSWDYCASSHNIKPSHIRFSDTDETKETETSENNFKFFDKTSTDFNSLKVSNNETQSMTDSTPLVKENENKKDCSSITKAQNEVYEELVGQESEVLNSMDQTDSGIEKNELANSQPNLSDLESLKLKVRHPTVCMRFY